MAFFKKKISEGMAGAQASAPRFDYYPPDDSHVVGVTLQKSSAEHGAPDASRLNADGLIGASALESALFKGSHLEADVFSELAKSMQVIEEKFHAGMYDAQAMPLVEAFLSELHELADIQVERAAINNSRINDMKEANKAAYDAVFAARTEREMGIEAARLASLDYATPDYEEIIARAEEKRKHKDARRAARYAHKEARQAARLEKRGASSEERLTSWSKAKEDRRARSAERQEQRQEALLRKQQAKMERIADKQRVARQEAQQKLDELRRAEEAREAEARVMQAQAEADVERARTLAQSARAESEKARLEELQARAAQEEFDNLEAVCSEEDIPAAGAESLDDEAAVDVIPDAESASSEEGLSADEPLDASELSDVDVEQVPDAHADADVVEDESDGGKN